MMRKQAERFGAEIISDDATELDLTGDDQARRWSAARTTAPAPSILAMGSAYRELGVPGEKRLSGHGVSWCATCDGFFFRDQDIAVVGGGDSAVEEATFLTRFGESVTLVHRRDALRASKIMAERACANPKIEFAWNSEVDRHRRRGQGQRPRAARHRDRRERTLPVAGVFVAIGHDPRNELVRGQVDLDDEGYVLVDAPRTQTNVPGVFACGDLVDHTYRQAITAAGTGCAAALDAEHYLAGLPAVRAGDPSEPGTTAPVDCVDHSHTNHS